MLQNGDWFASASTELKAAPLRPGNLSRILVCPRTFSNYWSPRPIPTSLFSPGRTNPGSQVGIIHQMPILPTDVRIQYPGRLDQRSEGNRHQSRRFPGLLRFLYSDALPERFPPKSPWISSSRRTNRRREVEVDMRIGRASSTSTRRGSASFDRRLDSEDC